MRVVQESHLPSSDRSGAPPDNMHNLWTNMWTGAVRVQVRDDADNVDGSGETHVDDHE